MNQVNFAKFKVVIFILLLLSLFTGLHILDLRAEEPRRALIALEMLFSKNYIVPSQFGVAYYNKLPFFNWLLALFAMPFDKCPDFIFRLPGLFALTASSFLVYKTMKKQNMANVALLGAAISLAFGDILFYGAINAGEIDLFFAFIVTASAFSFFHFYQKERYLSAFLISYLLTAISFLTKGLVGPIFHILSLFAYLVIVHKKWRLFLSWQHILAGFLAVSLVVSYFLAYKWSGGDWNMLLLRQFGEVVEKGKGDANFLLPLFTNPFIFLKVALPFSLIPFLLFFKKERTTIYLKENEFVLFCFTFIISNCIVYLISQDLRERYTYPFLPFLAILLAYIYNKITIIKNKRIIWYVILVMSIGKLAYNFIGMPIQAKALNNQFYDDIALDLAKAANNNKIAYLSFAEKDTLLLGVPVLEEKNTFIVDKPAFIPYQIPYHLIKNQKTIMTWERQAQKGAYYLIEMEEFQERFGDSQQVLFEFREHVHKKDLYLFQYK